MATDRERLLLWFDSEMTMPVTHYKEPLRELAQRAAAAALLGKDLESFVPDLAALAPMPQELSQRGDLAAAKLLVANVIDDAARACVAGYSSDPEAASEELFRAYRDEIALGAALLTDNPDVARSARSHRTRRQFDNSVAYAAELVFLADEILHVGSGDPVLFSAVRGIDQIILSALNRTVAPFVCAFGAVAGAQLSAQLRGGLQRYDELSFAGKNAPYRLKPEQLKIDSRQSRITLVAAAMGHGFRLDVISAPELLDALPSALTWLRKTLSDKERRAFDKLRKEPETELEILIPAASRLKGGDVFARRVAAALALMKPSNYAIEKVVVNEA